MTIRELPFEEWDKLDGLPFSANGLPNPDTCKVLVAEDANEIVSVWSVVTAKFLEGMWVREDHRKTTVTGRMVQSMKSFLAKEQIESAYTIVQDSEVRRLAEKAGFDVIPGDFCVLYVEGEV